MGDNACSEEVSDRGVTKVALPVTPVVVAHNGVGRLIKGDSIVFATTRAVDFGGVVSNLDSAIGKTSESFVNFNLWWERPVCHFSSIAKIS